MLLLKKGAKMNDSEIIFEYFPQGQESAKRKIDNTLLLNVASGIVTIALGLFIISFIYHSAAVLFISIALFIIFIVCAKGIAKERNAQYDLCVVAYDESLYLAILDNETQEVVEETEIEYADIQFGYFTDKSCTNYVLLLTDGENIRLNLKAYSWQQYYFLYIASDYFNLRSPAPWKIIKKFGTRNQYEEALLKRGEKA